MKYTDPISFGNRRLQREDAKIRRCTCGAWCYGEDACGTCGTPVGSDGGACDDSGVDQRHERHTG